MLAWAEEKEDVHLNPAESLCSTMEQRCPISHRSLCLLYQPHHSQTNLLENPKKVSIPEDAWNIV